MGVSGEKLKITSSDKGWILKNVSAVSIRKHQGMQKPNRPTVTVIAVCISSLGVPALSRSGCCIGNDCGPLAERGSSLKAANNQSRC